MKKKVAVSLIVLFITGIVSTSHAFNGVNQGTTRLVAMGLMNYQTEDFGNQWRNPAYVMQYKNRVRGFFGGYTAEPMDPDTGPGANDRTTAWSGLNYESPFGTWGLWLDRPEDATIDQMDSAVADTGYEAFLSSAAGATGATLDTVSASDPTNNLDILYGRSFGAFLFGVRLNYNASSDETKIDSPSTAQPVPTNRATLSEDSLLASSRDLGLHLGVILKDMPIKASLLIGLPSLESTAKISDKLEKDTDSVSGYDTTTTANLSDNLESDGAMNLGLYVNSSYSMSDKINLIPTLRIETTKNDSKRTSSMRSVVTGSTGTKTSTFFEGSGKREDSSTLFGIDAAFNIKPNDKTLVVSAIGLDYTSSEATMKNEVSKDETVSGSTTTYLTTYGVWNNVKVETSEVSIPFVVGIENKSIKDGKVIVRAGVRGNLYRSTETETSDVDYYTDTATNPDVTKTNTTVTNKSVFNGTDPATVSMGVGYKFSDSFSIAGVLNQDILFTGTYLISGVPETLFTGVLAEYTF